MERPLISGGFFFVRMVLGVVATTSEEPTDETTPERRLTKAYGRHSCRSAGRATIPGVFLFQQGLKTALG